jgi:uncharacterized protein HemX
MSQRNPMNERYQEEGRKGVARKSAASAKPKAKAAASVTTVSKRKTPQQKKADQKAARKAEQQRQRELDRKYYTPDTERYKKLRRTWWVLLVAAIVCVILSYVLRSVEPTWIAMVTLFAAYALIIAAFYVDFSKIRKERTAYQKRMVALEAAREKEEKHNRAKAAKNTEGVTGDQSEPAKEENTNQKKSGLAGLFGGKKQAETAAE